MLQKHQKAILDWEVIGTIQDRFNFSLSNTSFQNRRKHIYEKIVAIENCHYLINYSFGYILKNFVTNEFRYFHASGGTDRVLLSSRLISRTEELMEFLLSISDDDLFHGTRKPDSQWVVDKVTNITFFLTKRINCPIGCGQNLANFVMDNPGVHALI